MKHKLHLAKLIITPVTITAFFIVIIPAFLLLYLGLAVASVPIMVYFQLLLLKVQLEISNRQNKIFSTQFFPFFSIILKDVDHLTIGIKNISGNPAYNIILRVLDINFNPISPNTILGVNVKPFMLAPGQENDISLLNSGATFIFKQERYKLAVSYTNQLGKEAEVFITLLGNGLILIPQNEREEGYILNMLEKISYIYKAFPYINSLPKHQTIYNDKAE